MDGRNPNEQKSFNWVYQNPKSKNSSNTANAETVKLYCFDIYNKDRLIAFGGESEKKPFMAVHTLGDSNINLLGYNPLVGFILDFRIKEQKKELGDQEYKKVFTEYQKEKDKMNLHMAYLSLPDLSRCIFNIKFLDTKQKIIAASDFRTTVVLAELTQTNILKQIGRINVHTDIIQSLLVVKDTIFTTGCDRTVNGVRIAGNICTTTDQDEEAAKQ